ncbi:MAG: membrane protein insertion efficiency factor YidD [candidate division WOR-3 bacterium]|jgi:putative component of membrane protein insertase Oxa1/YidC/SpoIIIJ protein YidD
MVNLITCFLSLSLSASAEIKNQMDFISEVNPVITEKTDERYKSFFNLKETSEVRLAFTGIIRLYQIFISSQDAPSCNFTLTCSRFTTKAIQKYGAIHGILMGGDRLQRCFGLSRKYYPLDPETGYAIDYPVEVYYLGGAGNDSFLYEFLLSHQEINWRLSK